MNIFFASDHHFQHSKILEYSEHRASRFADLDEMHDTIITNHNAIVGKNDIVYLLGDVVWKSNAQSRELLNALNGKKRLVVGNHDNVKFLYPEFVEEVHLWKYFPNFDFIASHVPLSGSDLDRTTLNVHGHLHEKSLTSFSHMNVSLEATNYTPVALDSLLVRISTMKELTPNF